ncbi:unnamed protein product [Calypogeia fissa]
MNLKFLPKFMRPRADIDSSDHDDRTSESDCGSASEEETYGDCLSDVEPEKRERLPTQNSLYPPLGSIALEPTVSTPSKGLSEYKKRKLSPTQSSVCSPLGSSTPLQSETLQKIFNPSKASTVHEGNKHSALIHPAPDSLPADSTVSSNGKDGCFVGVDPTDSFVQTNTPFKSVDPYQISTPSKGSTDYKKASVNPPLGFTPATEASVSSPKKEGPFVNLDSDNFAHTATRLMKSSLSSNGKADHFVNPDSDNFAHTATRLKSETVSTQSKGPAEFKNDLQTNCQRHRVDLPVYTHSREGPAHAPNFHASVRVGGNLYHCQGSYKSKVDAEQAAAKEALAVLDQLDSKSTVTAAGSQSNFGLTGDANVPLKSVKAEVKGRTSAGLTIETAIDLTEDEGSSPPNPTLSTPAYNTRSLSAAKSYHQLWGASEESTPPRAAPAATSVQKKRANKSDSAPAPSGIDSNVHSIVGKLLELQLKESVPDHEFVRHTRERQSVKWPPQTEHLKALGKLDFATHGFPILTRLKGLPLEEVFSVKEIEGLRNLSAENVNQYLSDIDRARRRLTPSAPLRVQLDPEYLCYECHIDTKGKFVFKTSENKQGSTILHRTLGFDKVLQVFLEDCYQFEIYKHILKDGIFAGPRVYQYFVHKDDDDDDKSAEEEKRNTQGKVKCYFVCTDSMGENDLKDKRFTKFNSIVEARTFFVHVDTLPSVSKYIARLQLCLSKTMTIKDISFSDVVIEEMEDLPSKDEANPSMFTDGTGFISTDLARLMPTNIFKGTQSDEGQKNELREDYPSLVQVRVFHKGAAYKGTLLANKELPPNTIKFYDSMKKVRHNPQTKISSISSFELVSTSRPPRRAKLSRDLIVLLSIGGVDESVFLDALTRATEEVLLILRDRKRAHQELEWDGGNELAETTRHMLRAGIPMNDPGLHQNLVYIIKNKFKDFAIGRVPLDGTFYVMGTADPTGTLKSNEVAIFENGCPVTGNVVIHRHPGKHPGDPHIVDAVYSKALHDIVGGEKNVIFFPTQGTRPLTHEIANGDLDGDVYWICENKKGQGESIPSGFSSAGLEDALLDEYLKQRFDKSQVVGTASMRWLTHVDAYLHPETSPKDRATHLSELLKYPDYIYEAVDSAKTGKQVTLFPQHEILRKYYAPYLWKKASDGRGEKSILGKIFQLGTEQEAKLNPSFSCEDFKVDPAFIVPGSESYLGTWERNYKDYLQEMARAIAKQKDKPDGMNLVNKSWKMVLYGVPSFKESMSGPKERETVLREASAIYQVVYRAQTQKIDLGNAPAVAFVWNKAGVALATIYAEKQPKQTIVYSDGAHAEIHRRSKASGPAARRTVL